jgi:hypothetical protein
MCACSFSRLTTTPASIPDTFLRQNLTVLRFRNALVGARPANQAPSAGDGTEDTVSETTPTTTD